MLLQLLMTGGALLLLNAQGADGKCEEIGFPVTPREKLDTRRRWTMIHRQGVASAGYVEKVAFFAGADLSSKRKLFFGVYEPVPGGDECEFNVKQRVTVRKEQIQEGLNEILFSGADRLHVGAGDHLGFTWLHYGVITYNKTSDVNYCDANIKPKVNEKYNFDDDNGDREYSVRFTLKCGDELRIRMSLRELSRPENAVKLNAFLRAWKLIKDLPPDNPNSFWAIGGFHGEPFQQPLPGHAGGFRWGGWCNHANVLFPTWHRAYMLRLEQALKTVCPDDDIAMVYWDETSDETLAHGAPDLLTKDFVMIDGQEHRNPLKSFKIPFEITGVAGDMGYRKPAGYTTVRYPYSGIEYPPGAKTKADDHNKMIDNMPQSPTELFNLNLHAWFYDANAPGYNTRTGFVFDKFEKSLNAPNYNVYSNTNSQGSNYVAIETPHNDLHLAIGGATAATQPGVYFGQIEGSNGDMGDPETAGFDPIFFFHHCNIDRMFWVWQKKHHKTEQFTIDPDDYPGTHPECKKWGQGFTPSQGPPGDQLNMDTPLTPFYFASGVPMTSNGVINIHDQKLGYDYTIGSLDQEVWPDAPQTGEVVYHHVSDVSEIGDHLSAADGYAVKPTFIFSAGSMPSSAEWQAASVFDGAQYHYNGHLKIKIGNIDRQAYPGSMLIHLFHTEIKLENFIGYQSILDRSDYCDSCGIHRYTERWFDLKGLPWILDPSFSVRGYKAQVVYFDRNEGKHMYEELPLQESNNLADDNSACDGTESDTYGKMYYQYE